MASRTPHTPRRRLLLALPLAMALISLTANASAQFRGQSRHRFPSLPQTPEKQDSGGFRLPFTDPDDNTVRLSFYNTPWEKVLKKVAEETRSVLVMDDPPPGRFTRHDFTRKYTRSEAVRILNEALRKEFFRLEEDGNRLKVIDTRALRTKYPRPQIPLEHSNSVRHAAAENPASHSYRDGFRGNPAVPPGDPRLTGNRPRLNSLADYGARRTHSAAIRPMSHTADPTAGAIHPGPVPRVPRQAPPIVTRVRTHASAVNVAKAIYRELRNRSELLDAGPASPAGLPAFRIFGKSVLPLAQSGDEGPAEFAPGPMKVLFTVGIDSDRNELVISAPSRWAARAEHLIRLIDSAPETPSGVVRLVSHEGDVRQIAQVLQRQVNVLAAQQQPGANNQPQQQPPEQNQQQPPDQQRPGTVRIESIGPVEIEYVPGIGLVLRGAEKDVEAVRRIIDALDLAAAGTVPQIEHKMLQYVNSESMAELLNSVYSGLATIRGGDTDAQATVNVIPVINPNMILILAPQAAIDDILDTVDRLDQPVDPEASLKIFRLRYAVATQVATQLESLFPQPPADQPGLRPRITVVVDARTNSVIVQAQPRDMEAVVATVTELDHQGPESVNQGRVIPLQNAVAEELAEVINTTIQGVINPAQQVGQVGQFGGAQAGQVNQELLEAKSVVLEFLTGDDRGRRVIRSGVLSDIRVTAEPRINALVVTAPEQSMLLMEEMIAALDRQTTLTADMKIIPLENADATAMVDLLESLFAPDDEGQADVTFAGGEDASSGLIPVRFSVDVRTNTVIAVGGSGALQVVEAVLYTLDESDTRQRVQEVIKLNNTPAQDVAGAITAFLQSQRDLATLDPDLVSNVELLEREIIVIPEVYTNNLIVSATKRYIDVIREMIAQIDKTPPQVVIQALLVEVELDNTDEFGVELGFQDSILFDRGLLNLENFRTITNTVTNTISGVATTTEQIVNQETVPGFNFANASAPLGNNTAINPSSVGSQGLSNFSLGRVNGDLGFGGLVLSAQSESVSVLIRALASRRNVHILSRPQILTQDNVQATILVGQEFPIIDDFLPGDTTTAPTPVFTRDSAGISLTVTPQISPDGLVSLITIAEKSAFSGEGVPLIADPTTGNVIESPIKDVINAATTVTVPDGQTVVIGGMITKSDDTLERKVPWLGDLPLLGSAFRYDSTSSRRTELLIFLTPRIIKKDVDSEFIKQVESERMHMIFEKAEEIHGPIMGAPAEALRQQTPPPRMPDAPESGGYGNTNQDRLPVIDFGADPDRSVPTTDITRQNAAPFQSGHSPNASSATQYAGAWNTLGPAPQNSDGYPQQQPQQPPKRQPFLRRIFPPRGN